MKLVKTIFIAFIFLTVCVEAGFSQGSDEHGPNGNQEGIARADLWLALIDGCQYPEAWQTSAKVFQAALSSEQWSRTAASVRDPLGSLIERKLSQEQFSRSMPGMPDGQYLILQYHSKFERKSEAIEIIILLKDNKGTWRVAGYFLN